jgi:phosphate transport system substrate-binding protein
MEAMLKDLNALPGVIGSMFCDAKGRVLANAFPSQFEGPELRQAATELAERTRGLREATGKIRLIDMRYADARLVVKPFGDYALLFLCAKTVNLQLLLVSAAVAGKKLERLAAPPPPEPAMPGPIPMRQTVRSVEILPPDHLVGGEPASKAIVLAASEPPMRKAASAAKSALLFLIAAALGAGGAIYYVSQRLAKDSPGGGMAAVVRAVEARPSSAGPSPSAVKPMLRLAGGDAIGGRLGPALAEAFLAKEKVGDIQTSTAKPGETIVQGTKDGAGQAIAVVSGMTSAGFDGLLAGTAEIAIASRRIRDDERQKLVALGNMTSRANEHVLGLDGIAVVVNPANNVPRLKRVDLAAIFSGGVSDWSAVGITADAQSEWAAVGTTGQGGVVASGLHLYVPDGEPGIVEIFRQRVLGGGELTIDAKRVASAEAVRDGVLSDAGGIGLVPLPWVGGARAVPVADADDPPMMPSPFTVSTEEYLLTHRLYLYTSQASANPQVSRFVEFALGPEGQAVVEKMGFAAMTVRAEQRVAPARAPKRYVELTSDARLLSSTFRFETNSSAFDNRAQRDLERVVQYLHMNGMNGAQVRVLGFADAQGDKTHNQELSRQRAAQVAAAFAERGISGVTVAAMGWAMPVADNATQEGRERNRRVEIWVGR